MIRVYRSGKVEEKVIFPIHAGAKTRKPKSKGSLARTQDSNERNGIKRLARIINCNFEPGDLLIKLGYDNKTIFTDDLNADFEKAEKNAELFMRRLKNKMKKAGIDSRYVYITSDMDGDTGEHKRLHHHLVIKSEGFKFCDGRLFVCGTDMKKIWKHGSISIKTLFNCDTYAELAAYLYRQTRRITAGDCKYHASRNLKKPVLISERIVHSNRRLRLPKGAKLITRTESEHLPDGVQYLCYVINNEKEEKNERKRKPLR